jgi:hypothetical protein
MRTQRGWLLMIAATGLLTGPLAMADVPARAAETERALWTQKELVFRYTGFSTKYTCDGLTDKMRRLLIMLGARASDLEVTSFACLQGRAAASTPGVRVRMHVLEPAAATGSDPAVPARWKPVDLLAHRDPLDAAGDCELIGQLRQKVIPLFAVRNLDYAATCSHGNPSPGGTRLKAEVLVPDQRTADSAH